jgi:hypothetical protein
MSTRFRPTSPDDAAAIAQLMQQVFGMDSDHPGLDAKQMAWKYWRKHPEWEGSRGFVVERDGNILAHGSVIPLRCAWGGLRLKLVELVDWVAQPNSTGAGIALLKRVAQAAEGMFIAGGTEMTQKILPALGFRESASATNFALPLRPLARLRADSVDSWKPLARFARNTIWKSRAASAISPGWKTRRIAPAGLAAAPFPMPRPSGRAAAVFERSVPAIAYMLECPAAPAEFYLVERNGVVCGYFILTLALAQCRVADAWLESNLQDDWQALYQLAASAAKAHPAVTEIVTVAGDRASAQGLALAGFRPRGQVALRFLIPKIEPPAEIRYQMVDNDAAYLYDGEGEKLFWT